MAEKLRVDRIADLGNAMSSPLQSPKTIELHGIERVLPENRFDQNLWNNFTLWLSANFVIPTLALGTLAQAVFKLGTRESLLVILVFNLIAAFPAAILATLGPQTGLRQMTLSRYSFGWNGTKLMALLNAATCIGWSAVNVLVGAQLSQSIGISWLTPNLTIILISVFTTVVSLYGYSYVHRYERYAWIPMVLVFFSLFWFHLPHFNNKTSPLDGFTWWAAILSFGGTIFGYAAAWCAYASDYNVNQREETQPQKVFWFTYLGILIPCISIESLGVLLSTVAHLSNKTGGDLLAEASVAFGMLRTLLLILLLASLIANNTPNDYSLGLSLQLLGQRWQKVNRGVWTVLGSIAYVILALCIGTRFNEALTDFLLLITYWISPWVTIILIEHFYFRKGKYDLESWNNRNKLPNGIPAIISLGMGLFGAFLGGSQPLFIGPASKLLINADVGFELSILFSATTYLLIRQTSK